MFDLQDLYQQVIVDHNRSPRNFGKIDNADISLEGFNPLCGDKLTLYLKITDNRIEQIAFDGSGCAISVASASLMTETMQGKTIEEANQLFDKFHNLLMSDIEIDFDEFGKLAALAGVREYPSRVKCASLCWHTLHSSLSDNITTAVSTE